MDITEVTNKAVEIAVEYAPKFIMAIITLIIGLWIIKKMMNLLDKSLAKNGMDFFYLNFYRL